MTCVYWPMVTELQQPCTGWKMDWCEKMFGLFQSSLLPIRRCAAQKSNTDHQMASWEIPIRARKSQSRIYSWLPLVIHATADTNCTRTSVFSSCYALDPGGIQETHTHTLYQTPYLQLLQTVWRHFDKVPLSLYLSHIWLGHVGGNGSAMMSAFLESASWTHKSLFGCQVPLGYT